MSEMPRRDRPSAEPSRRVIALLVATVPLAVAVGVAATVRWVATAVGGALGAAPLWYMAAVISLPAAVLAVAALDRTMRRVLPLRALAWLAELFPEHAPRQLSAAMRAAPMRTSKASGPPALGELVAELTEHDRFTRGHSERVRAITRMIATEMDIEGVARERLEWAALLHDVGKVEISPGVLNKPGPPDEHEWVELREHPRHGVVVAGPVAEWLGEDIHAIDQHHERFDGSGYPRGLRGQEISRAARIVAVADAYEVMTANRSYKQAMAPARARAELVACSGTHFDPSVVRAFASLSLAPIHPVVGLAGWALAVMI